MTLEEYMRGHKPANRRYEYRVYYNVYPTTLGGLGWQLVRTFAHRAEARRYVEDRGEPKRHRIEQRAIQ